MLHEQFKTEPTSLLTVGKFSKLTDNDAHVVGAVANQECLSDMPFMLFWLDFFACIWLCSHHRDQEYEGRANYQTKTSVIPGDSDHCPIEQARGVIPKASTINLQQIP